MSIWAAGGRGFVGDKKTELCGEGKTRSEVSLSRRSTASV